MQFAAGDVANFHNAALDLRQRVEHENAAISMGGHAGRAMTGSSEPYTLMPYFYSDLFDLGYEAVGLLDDRLDVVENWTVPYREGVVYYIDNGRVRGVLLWNVWGQVDAARELIAERGPHDAESVRGRLPRMVVALARAQPRGDEFTDCFFVGRIAGWRHIRDLRENVIAVARKIGRPEAGTSARRRANRRP